MPFKLVNEDYPKLMQQNKVDFYAIGKRGAEYLRKNHSIWLETIVSFLISFTFENVMPVAEKIMDDYILQEIRSNTSGV